ncbi:MAG: PAS domain S-box protein, partial [Actinobacteria bacterium]|nr:PAS domain S-box protein [Actinomycetota bacterium]
MATNLAYPLADVLILSLLLGVFALSGWRPHRSWVLLAGAFAFQAISDSVYLYQTASGTYQGGGLLDTGFIVTTLLIALVAWHRPEATDGGELLGWPALAITSTFAAVGLFLMTFDHWHPLPDVVQVLATTTIVVAFVRSAMTFSDMRTLAGKELSMRNESILRAAGEGIYGIDRYGVVTFANPAAIRLTGHELGELEGEQLHQVVHHTRPDGSAYPAAESQVLASLEDATVHRSADEVYWRKDGSSFPVEYTSTPIVEDGEVKGAVVVFKDITERREVERAKDEFTSVVSHELRTPLTSIRGSLGLLESGVLGPLPEKGQRMVEIAVENTDRLVRLINDILDIERIDSGKIDM